MKITKEQALLATTILFGVLSIGFWAMTMSLLDECYALRQELAKTQFRVWTTDH